MRTSRVLWARLAGAGATLGAALAAGVALAPAAGAWHIDIGANIACGPNASSATVSYTATSWTGGPEGANPQVNIEVDIDPAGAPVAFGPRQVVDTIAFGNQPNPPSVQDSFVLQGVNPGDTVRVYSVPVADWPGGNEAKPTQTRVSNNLTVPGPCNVQTFSANPGAEFEECAEQGGVSGVVVTLRNTGNATATFSVEGESVDVAPGGTATRFFAVAEDAPFSIDVAGPGGFNRTFAGTRDCAEVLPAVLEATTSTPTTVPTEVLGAVLQQPLARTGTDIARQVLFGLAVLGFGTTLVLTARQRRARLAATHARR